ncbi:hypothetical protein ACP4OV_003088 [Aristida adscensionis]
MVTAGALAVFAGKTVAGAAIKEIVTKAFSYLNDYFGTPTMEELKNKLDRGLPKIKAVLEITSPDQVKDKSRALDAWFWQLRDAVERTEDAMDELEYYKLEEKAQDRKVADWGSRFDKMKHRAVKQVKNVRFLDKTVKGLTHRGTLNRMRKAVEDLDRAANTVMDFFRVTEHKGWTSRSEWPSLNKGHETGSTLTVTEVFGRDREKELVTAWLTGTSVEDAEIAVSTDQVSVVSIVGHGGMGKTTLAQLICQDDAVTKHFEIVIWACVSTSFDVNTITSNILQSARWPTPNTNNLDAMQKTLREITGSIKFLLVLDDVWEDKNRGQWETLFAPLRTGKSGSKILLTTRMKSVADLAADAMTGQPKCLPLNGLKEDENIKLFSHIAFPSTGFQDENLRPIGKQIAKYLRGCPLVTKVVASHLKGKQFQEWNNFLDQKLENFEGSSDDVMNILKLSYYHLPTELQTCFRYCSIFPQDHKFDKAKLVEMWMSSGLISQPAVGSQSLLETAEQYVDQLTKKSFFDLRYEKDHLYQVFQEDYLGQQAEESGHYVMHDLMHDLAKSVSSGECARIVDVTSLKNVVDTVRHICLEDVHDFRVEEIKKITRLKKLRTIIITTTGNNYLKAVNKDILIAVEELVESSKSLRVFETKLRHTSDFLCKLGMLKHLRSIGLQQGLPKYISGVVKLYHLTRLVWHFSFEQELKHLRGLGNLDRLRYVRYGSGYGNFPVCRLDSLLVLNNYQIQSAKGYTISALKDLRSLRILGVEELENITNQEEAKEANLKGKQYLESLTLKWSQCDNARSMIDEFILDNLEPHANLMKLYISCFSGTRTPQWIAEPSVRNLVRLEFKRCEKLEQLPILAILTLKHLKLEDLPRLSKIGQALNAFGDECIEFLPPCLLTFEVSRCSELVKLPLLPPSLVLLEVLAVGLTMLPRIGKLQNGNTENVSAQLRGISVACCDSLTSLEGSLFEQRQYMGAVSELRISSCYQLESAPIPFEVMNGLRDVWITQCPKLRALRGAEDKLMLSSLRDLFLQQCGDLELLLLGSLQGVNNLNELLLWFCSTVESLPSTDVFKSLKSVRNVELWGCESLSSLGGLGSLHSIDVLKIFNCPKLAEGGLALPRGVSGGEEENMVVPTTSLRIDFLEIDLPSMLLVEPLNTLCHTEYLWIQDGAEMESLPEPWLLQNRSSLRWLKIEGAQSLESLPPTMRDLSSLKDLVLGGAEKLQSLSDLPSSLEWLKIWGCSSELGNKFAEYGSPDWNKISHVRRVIIGVIHTSSWARNAVRRLLTNYGNQQSSREEPVGDQKIMVE